MARRCVLTNGELAQSHSDGAESGDDLTSYLLADPLDSVNNVDDDDGGDVKEITVNISSEEGSPRKQKDSRKKSLYFGEIYDVEEPLEEPDVAIGERVKYGKRRKAADKAPGHNYRYDYNKNAGDWSYVESCQVRLMADWDCCYKEIDSIIKKGDHSQVLPLAEIISLSLYGIKEFSSELINTSQNIPGESQSESDVPVGNVICLGPVVKYKGVVDKSHCFEVCVNPEYRSDNIPLDLSHDVKRAINDGVKMYKPIYAKELTAPSDTQVIDDLEVARDGVQIAMVDDTTRKYGHASQVRARRRNINKGRVLRMLQQEKCGTKVTSAAATLVTSPSAPDGSSEDSHPHLSVILLSKTVQTETRRGRPSKDISRNTSEMSFCQTEPVSMDSGSCSSGEEPVEDSDVPGVETTMSSTMDIPPPVAISVNPPVLVIQPDDNWLSLDTPEAIAASSVSKLVRNFTNPSHEHRVNPRGVKEPGANSQPSSIQSLSSSVQSTSSGGTAELSLAYAADGTVSVVIDSGVRMHNVTPTKKKRNGIKYFPGFDPGRPCSPEPNQDNAIGGKKWYLEDDQEKIGCAGRHRRRMWGFRSEKDGHTPINEDPVLPTVLKTEPVDPECSPEPNQDITRGKKWYVEDDQEGIGCDGHLRRGKWGIRPYKGDHTPINKDPVLPTVLKTEPVDPEEVAREVFKNGCKLSFTNLQKAKVVRQKAANAVRPFKPSNSHERIVNRGENAENPKRPRKMRDKKLENVIRAEKHNKRSLLSKRGTDEDFFPGYISKKSGSGSGSA